MMRAHPLKATLTRYMAQAGLSLTAILLVVGVVRLGSAWEAEDEVRRIQQAEWAAQLREGALDRGALRFLASKGSDANTYLVRLKSGIEMPALSTDGQTFTFPAIHATTKQACIITVSALGDLAAEAVWLRPTALTCDGVEQPITGEVRDYRGRILEAQVIGDSKGWLLQPTFTLKLPPYTTVRAWVDKSI